ncbi:predicted protein [Naegleria gruberi]|uniref:Predicted protein n=1 Tax=Naegleria gruberi TaxID=5762 RepID=D2VTB3_NAEGR|nr:uncharacterized protein NAEGRDRAFT_72239 [Naegleria gruberi]EFC39830.1 predicted protein [Naegleria gruberi]|eukprot:XP_002672574.1 predicted protein [Naegleria gruberi strain NEG-M]
MRHVCKVWNLLLTGQGSESSSDIASLHQSISKTIKEVLKNDNFRERVEKVYLPRLYYQIFLDFLPRDEPLDSLMIPIMNAFKNKFGDEAVRRISRVEFEVDFMMENHQVLENVEHTVDKTIILSNERSDEEFKSIENPNKLFHVDFEKKNNPEEFFAKYKPLDEIFGEWKNRPFIDNDMLVNPYRLYRKVILQFKVYSEEFFSKGVLRLPSTEISIGDSSNIYEETDVALKSCLIRNYSYQETTVYKFKPIDPRKDMEKLMEYTIYYFLKHRLLRRMDKINLSLKELLEDSKINYLTQLNREDQYYFLTMRESMLKKCRDSLISDVRHFNGPISEKINASNAWTTVGHRIEHYLSLTCLDTMNNYQRVNFLKQFFNFMYKEKLNISEKVRKEVFKKFGIDHIGKSFTFTETPNSLNLTDIVMSFEKEFDHDKNTVYCHEFIFPSFPIMSICDVKETTPFNTSKKTTNDYSSRCCCSNLFQCCRALYGVMFHPDRFED